MLMKLSKVSLTTTGVLLLTKYVLNSYQLNTKKAEDFLESKKRHQLLLMSLLCSLHIIVKTGSFSKTYTILYSPALPVIIHGAGCELYVFLDVSFDTAI